ncbi:MAG: hypothetical protein OEZ47_15490, partial [Gammaproteobacteria bacterium]|nr:hypothetical protein [Gammaproteobacteria bacterium]
DPIYVLPWYLMLGNAGYGKTRAIKNSRVAIPLVEEKAQAGQEAMPSWWLLDEAIMIDTPGRYVAQREKADTVEWQHFLSSFNKHRKWLPVNGVVVALPVDMLLNSPEQEIKSYAMEMRSRLAELIQQFGVRFPVYIMLTKADLLGGMTQFFDPFPEAVFSQAMGALSEGGSRNEGPAAKVERIFFALAARLKKLRLASLSRPESAETLAPTLVFPEEVANLKAQVSQFASQMLDPGFYTEAPVLRGIYFTSARQEGTPSSSMLPSELNSELIAIQRTGERAYFLKGFLGRVLKTDKNLVAPTERAVNIQNIRHNLGVSSWVAACVICGVVLSAAFFQKLGAISSVNDELPVDLVVSDNIDKDLAMLSGFRRAIENIKQRNVDAWAPSFGLTQSAKAEEQLAIVYASKLREVALIPFNQVFDQVIERVSEETSPGQLAALVDFMSKRISLHQVANETEQDIALIQQASIPDFTMVLSLTGATESDKAREELSKNFVSYLAWTDNQKLLDQDKTEEEQRLAKLLAKPGVGLEWLAEWANLQPELAPVKVSEFWSREVAGSENFKTVRPAYTAEGWDRIQSFLADIEKAVPDKEMLNAKKDVFVASYSVDYFNEWKDFYGEFGKGATGQLAGKDGIETAQLIAGKNSPYDQLLQRTVAEISPVVDSIPEGKEPPGWVPLVFSYDELSKIDAGGGDNKAAQKLAKKATKFLGKFKGVAKGAMKMAKGGGTEKSENYFIAYITSLKQMADQTQSPQASFTFAKEAYDEAGTVVGEPKNGMNKVIWANEQMRKALGNGSAGEKVFWDLLAQRGEQVWKVVLNQSAFHLDDVWQNEVLASAEGLTGWSRIEALQGPEGKIWAFQGETAGSFIKKKRGSGYYSRELYKASVPFTPQYINVLNQGQVSQKAIAGEYKVVVSTLPTDVNQGATKKPHLTKLIVSCSSGNIEVLNYNHPVRKAINWSPQDCGDVILQINIGEGVLEHRYPGFNGFVNFLRDFRSGKRVFNRDNFPDQKALLVGHRINSISVAFRFRGQNSVLSLALKDPSSVPEKITDTGMSQYASNE